MNCGCDNRRDIMFTQGDGHIPFAILVAILATVVYITIK